MAGKKIKIIFSEAFNENNIGQTVLFILILGPLAYVFVKNTHFMSIIITILVGLVCYTWGHINGEKSGKNNRD